jgi:hypothetical protein
MNLQVCDTKPFAVLLGLAQHKHMTPQQPDQRGKETMFLLSSPSGA